ncbi:hypothetical protein RRG08_050297 [Elysia crispata]|uniref:Uncharacterized protein n=1 Tax=Elysia crispata TaxID=231223 RepID=A0AAE0ZYA5_9GAST|nr:hypothetical protein RRG08_050297 [Elysia crispata]
MKSSDFKALYNSTSTSSVPAIRLPLICQRAGIAALWAPKHILCLLYLTYGCPEFEYQIPNQAGQTGRAKSCAATDHEPSWTGWAREKLYCNRSRTKLDRLGARKAVLQQIPNQAGQAGRAKSCTATDPEPSWTGWAREKLYYNRSRTKLDRLGARKAALQQITNQAGQAGRAKSCTATDPEPSWPGWAGRMIHYGLQILKGGPTSSQALPKFVARGHINASDQRPSE